MIKVGDAPRAQEKALFATRVLMLINASVTDDTERQGEGKAPRRDYVMLADELRADVYDVGSMSRTLPGRLLKGVFGRGVAQALFALRRIRHYDVVFSDNEYTGFFVGLMLRSTKRTARHVLLAHHLTPRKKQLIARLARRGFDTLILHSEVQKDFAVRKLGFAREHIRVLPYQVDTAFWQPQAFVNRAPLISTAGLECRDYETLLAAVGDLPAVVVIAAASNWSSKRSTLRGRRLPPNVTVKSFDYTGLRTLYAQSSFVVVPLLEVDFQAGITTVLEGMAMAKAIVLTRTSGQQTVVQGPLWHGHDRVWPADGPTIETSSGIYVAPSDVEAWHAAMSYLLENPEVASVLGANGRCQVESELTVEQFANRFAKAIVTSFGT